MAAPNHNIKHIDIADESELARLAEEVYQSRQPRILRRAGQDLAIVLPIEESSGARRHRKTAADVSAFRDAAGSWATVDTDQLVEDICKSRRRSVRRPIDL
jgi:hypothetical protein